MTSQLVLIHIADVATVLAEVRRVLRPDGAVLWAEPDNQAGNYLRATQRDPRAGRR